MCLPDEAATISRFLYCSHMVRGGPLLPFHLLIYV